VLRAAAVVRRRSWLLCGLLFLRSFLLANGLACFDCIVADVAGGVIVVGRGGGGCDWRFCHRGDFLYHCRNHHLLIPIRILQNGLGGIVAAVVIVGVVAVGIAAVVVVLRGLRLAHVIVGRWSGIAAQMGGHVVRRMRGQLVVGKSSRIEGLWRRTGRLVTK